MPFTLTAVSPLTVTGSGPEGEYVVERRGYHPQLGKVFRYKDEKRDFYFYVQPKEGLRTLSVWHTSSEHFAGVSPAISAADVDCLKQNITHYFENVSIVSIDQVEPPIPVPSVIFEWASRR